MNPASKRDAVPEGGSPRAGAGVRPKLSVAGLLAVAAAYYLGAELGFVLRFPPATTSLIWPPNALLTTALLLTAPRRWWLCIAAALPAHALVELRAGFAPSFVAALFVTNCFEAVVAASAIRRLTDDPSRFDSLQRVMAFVTGGVLLAPLVSSFPDAAAVHFFQGEAFDVVFLRRLISNSLSQLLLVPSAVAVVRRGATWWRESTTRQRLQALALAIAVLLASALVFTGYQRNSSLLPGGPYTALPFLMPPLIFAAVRFGPGGTSLSLLATALLAIGSTTFGFTPLTALPAEERVRAFQVFLLVVGVPLLVVSALMQERRLIVENLSERLSFEGLLSQLSGAFVHVPSHEMSFEVPLERVARFVGVDGASLLRFTDDRQALVPVACWSERWQAQASRIERSACEWSVGRLLERAIVVCSDPSELPPQAVEKELLRREGVRSLLALPLAAGGQVLGCVALVATGEHRAWPEGMVANCRLVADVLAGALARKLAAEAAQKTREELAHFLRVSTIGELTTSIAHELNQPLTAILGNAQALLRRGAASPAEVEEVLRDVAHDAARGGQIIGRLRDLARRGESRMEPLDLNQAIGGTEPLLRPACLENDVALRFELEPELPALTGDAVQIQQVVLNLVRNALDASRTTGGGRPEIRVRTRREAGGVVAEVEDNGAPVDGEVVARLFEPFYTTKPSGLGMGLSICRTIVEAHGGRISAARNPQGGLTLRFRLPVPPPRPTNPQT